MVGINDPGLRTLLREVGAVVTWHPGERYVLITTAEPIVINFSVGDTRYDVGPLSAQATQAPYLGAGDEVFLPFNELLSALYLAPKREGNTNLLQPQLASVDVQGSGTQALLVARAGSALHPRVVSDSSDRVVYEFDGVGSMLNRNRSLNAGGIRGLEVTTTGSARDPKTFVTVLLNPGARHDAPHSNSGDFEVAFGGNGGAPPLVANQAPPPQATPAATPPPEQPQQQPTTVTPAPQDQPPSQGVATITAVNVAGSNDGANITVAVNGNANFEWHRLRDPDNRFWIDIKGATLQGPPIDQAEGDPLVSLRVRQMDAQTVRIALSMTGAKNLTVSPSPTGVTISVGREEIADAQRSGTGSVGSVVAVNEPQTLVTPVPQDQYGQNPAENSAAWKFGPHSAYVPTNPKLIVIDPGHGGSDRGAMRNGTSEADLTLDMAKRLRDILVARGWQVRMTRSTDVDVFAPNDSARDELQARVNVANNAGARMFVSIHVNSFINSGPSGTTTYYSKPVDVPLAQTMERNLSSLGTKDDGTVKSHLYVTTHSSMPAILIETAFLSNPSDYEKLVSNDWRQRVAQGIADGIDQYAQSNPVANGAGQ